MSHKTNNECVFIIWNSCHETIFTIPLTNIHYCLLYHVQNHNNAYHIAIQHHTIPY